jgi:hypothetical protein
MQPLYQAIGEPREAVPDVTSRDSRALLRELKQSRGSSPLGPARRRSVATGTATSRARKVVAGTARQIRRYAGRDAAMPTLLHELETDAEQFHRPMAPALLKEVHFASANVARSRDMSGRAMRSR